MAEIVLAAATSHTPMVCMRPEDWPVYALGDQRNGGLLDIDGERRSFDELALLHGERLALELTPERFGQRARVAQASLDRLATSLQRSAPDVAIIVGDDQDELFGPDGQPALAVYWGDVLETGARE